ncbi:lipopolysaccharide heptosyltransferase-I [Bdellovibrio bacteriovorus]|uniref:Lipopolysaccharide heptosyltransferase-I n=1 Tax=Bdellovibrio bacteriovorus TaxID=959 RepID=A0A150WRY9_BDEBC|nr:glycosyltransferase family 9 protein [Bdellovibrio bacteriovorus]KYG67222.1 lipopolysaccharide heptosyltransferase-I [Bdellovibrio bacteriovorus]
MKILVVSLLRLGDVIQQAALFRGLRQQNPDAEIHLLINQQFSHVDEVLPGIVDKYIYFDREALQKGIGEPAYNILWPYRQLEGLINQLNAEDYDVAYNFTHTKLSGYLLGATEIKNVKGLMHTEGRFQGLSNKWLRYFNDRFSVEGKSLFHYVELLGRSFDIPVTKTPSTISNKSKNKLVLFQCLTSKAAKNWNLEYFQVLKNMIETSLVDHKVRILGASFEKEDLLKFFAEEDLLICNLSDAKEYLSEAALLVTGDTSIKHLAAQAGTPIVELAIGPSDPIKTGAFSANSLVLQGDDLKPEKVFEAVWDQLSLAPLKMPSFSHLMERAVWSLHLDGDTSALAYEHRVREIRQQLPAEEINKSLKAWNQTSEKFATWMKQAKKALPSKEEISQKRQFHSADIADLILIAQDILKSKMDAAGYFQDFIEALLSRFAQPIQIHDRITKALTEIEALLEVRTQLTQVLQIPSMEGQYYAKGIGKLPVDGFAETGKGSKPIAEDSKLQPRDRETTAT